MSSSAEGDRVCPGCGGRKHTTIHTYKHLWNACSDCGSVVRTRKDRYLASRVPGLGRVVRSPLLRTALFEDTALREAEDSAYDSYKELCQRGIAGTKWERMYQTLEDELAPLGFSLDVPRALDVSGGPGFLGMELRDRGADVVVTEWSPAVAEAMHEALGLATCAYDFNVDLLSEVLPDRDKRFSAVLVRYALNFCLDLRRFAEDVAKVLEPGGWIYLSYVEPTLGCAIRWSHAEYVYNALYPAAVVRAAFESAGFRHAASVPTESKSYAWSATYGWRYRVMLAPYLARNLVTVGLRALSSPREAALASLMQHHREEIYVLL